ncbi:riboflavin synthase, alpha subunit [Pneumocystis carinii B80]|uniref:Riboflavin synthase n=1 Tax=Pneumocystis carinii (strain B80) TaxID=1408658 RepID=A0A0W4ZCP2_PNEC8|nr:riboflavin synthase, alpha subunit [Pneumocystis carinii B80]KTW26173.1 riboflavin synthase, alpha subunit [Pneumocystis carinii B80]
MFTGIIEATGLLSKIENHDGISWSISDTNNIISDMHPGDSISINGACLTITEINNNSFKLNISPETLKRTNFGRISEGEKVNLERAMTLDKRFGGHIVQGHIDTIATIVQKESNNQTIIFTFEPYNKNILKYIIEKGYIAIDGISLTVTQVNDNTFSIMLIPYTQKMTVTSSKIIGDTVNVEVDQMGKYVEKLLQEHIKKLKY